MFIQQSTHKPFLRFSISVCRLSSQVHLPYANMSRQIYFSLRNKNQQKKTQQISISSLVDLLVVYHLKYTVHVNTSSLISPFSFSETKNIFYCVS